MKPLQIKIFALALMACLAIGCKSKGIRFTEGTDFWAGITIPGTEDTVKLQIVNLLTGFHMSVKDNDMIFLAYETTQTNKWFGIIESVTTKSISADIIPPEQ